MSADAGISEDFAKLADTVIQYDVERIRAEVATGDALADERPDGRMHRIGRQ